MHEGIPHIWLGSSCKRLPRIFHGWNTTRENQYADSARAFKNGDGMYSSGHHVEQSQFYSMELPFERGPADHSGKNDM